MAILTTNELVKLRQSIAKGQTVTWVKADINKAMQAIEDFIENNRDTVSSDINTATAPLVFSNSIKKKMFAYYMKQKFTREGV